MYDIARKQFGQGGPKRIRYSLVPLIFRALKLAVRVKSAEESDSEWANKVKRILKFAHETVTALSDKAEGGNVHEVSLRLFLQCAHAANKCGSAFETISYEFVTQVKW